MKVRKVTKLGFLAGVVGFIGILAAVAMLGKSSASAYTGETGDCTGCHSYLGGNLRITTDTTAKTVAPGASFAVSISWTGGGGSRTEINWPNTLSNAQFTPTPRVPYSGSNASGTVSSTLTAPSATGTYAIKVYAAQKTPTRETDYKEMTITVAAPITSYTVTASAGANGSITPSGAVSVNSGANQTFTISASSGYHVTNVLVDGTSVGAVTSYTFTNVTSNRTITANFAITSYTISFNSNGGSAVTSITQNYGTAVNAPTPPTRTGYTFAGWYSNVGLSTPYIFTTMPAGSITLYAKWTAINSYTLTYTAGANGSITGTSPQTVSQGTSGTPVTAVPAAGYHFTNWSDSSTANPRTDSNVNGNISVTANFAITSYTISFNSNGGSAVTSITQNYGTAVNAPTPPTRTGYTFAGWYSNVGLSTPYIFTTMPAASITLYAKWTAINSYTLTYTAGANGSITGTSPQTVSQGASGTPVTAMPAAGYHFTNWSDSSTANPRTDTNVNGSISVTANFAINTYTITPGAVTNGTISPATVVTVNSGASQTFAITPNPGYHVTNVLVDGASVAAVTSYTFTNVTSNRTISATFAADAVTPASYTLTYTAGANGSITGTSPQTVSQRASGTPVTAVPAAGYHFTNWSDASTANPRTDTNVNGNISVTANFAIDTHTITPVAGANGSISPSGTVTVSHAADQTFTITAANGYHIAGIAVDGAPLATVQGTMSAATEIAVSSYTFTNITASHTLSATFAPHATAGTDTAGPLTAGLRFRSSSDSGSVTLNTLVDDAATGGSSIAAAEFFLDQLGAPGTGTAMNAADRSFSGIREAVRGTVSLSDLSNGGHTIYVRGLDAAGNWGAAVRLYFQVRNMRRLPTGEVRIKGPDDDDSKKSSNAIVIWIGTGRQQETDDDD